MYIFQGGNYTPDNIQDLFRGLGSDTAILLDGGGHRRSFCAVIPGHVGRRWVAERIVRHPSGAL